MKYEIPNSNIAEHLDILEEYGSKAMSILEIGCEYGTGSTQAFRRGREKRLYERQPCTKFVTVDLLDRIPKLLIPLADWEMVIGSSVEQTTVDKVKASFPIFDLIFIDTFHIYEHMRKELELWVQVAHDKTTWLFHDTWMINDKTRRFEYNHMTDAIKEFAERDGRWTYRDISKTCNGLGVLEPK